jgi:serine phosphatase RsbU (regulator of sigma subunit)
MAALTLDALINPKAGASSMIAALAGAMGGTLGIEDASGKPLLLIGPPAGPARVRIALGDCTLGWAIGPPASAAAIAALLTHLAAKESERRSLAAEVLHLYREVHLIEQLSVQLAAVLDVSAVGKSALDQARKLIAASRGGVLVMDEQCGRLRPVACFGGDQPPLTATCRLTASIIERGIAEIVNDWEADPRAEESEGVIGSLICAPLRAKQRAVGIIALANDAGTPYSAADLKLLNTIAMQTAAAIENTLLCVEMVDAARNREQLAAIQQDLETASAIQHALIPRIFPPFPERTDFDIHAQMTAARSVGGDFFDFFLIDDDRIGVVIGDVSGKGVPAALYMAVTLTHVRTIAQQGTMPEECLLEVNRLLVREEVSSMYATCFYAILNTRSGELCYCSAGHNPPYLLRTSGTVEAVAKAGGLPLGMFDGFGYTSASVYLAPGDALFLYTDGVPEGANPALEDFTDERLVASLRDGMSLPCREIIDLVMRDLLAFTAAAPQYDDITMLAVRIARQTGL